jgi:hypothetical protein
VTPVVVGSNPIIHPSDNIYVPVLGCGGCSSVVEPRIVTPVVVGSSPIIHPINLPSLYLFSYSRNLMPLIGIFLFLAFCWRPSLARHYLYVMACEVGKWYWPA